MSPDTRCEDALRAYLTINGFDEADYTAPTVKLSLGPFGIPFPNGEARQRAVPLHDLHHVATGFGSDLAGEAEIGAWELAAGCPSAFLVGINLLAVLIGMVVAPSRVLRAWRAGKGTKTLYVDGLPAREARALTVRELRARLGLPAEGIADPALVRQHSRAPREVAPAKA
jgi:hypothetical protein